MLRRILIFLGLLLGGLGTGGSLIRIIAGAEDATISSVAFSVLIFLLALHYHNKEAKIHNKYTKK